jgi:hypothetical protein
MRRATAITSIKGQKSAWVWRPVRAGRFRCALLELFSKPPGQLSEKRYVAPFGAVLQALLNFPSNAADWPVKGDPSPPVRR